MHREAAGQRLLHQAEALQLRAGPRPRRGRPGRAGQRVGVHVVALAVGQHRQQAAGAGRQARPGPVDQQAHLGHVVLVAPSAPPVPPRPATSHRRSAGSEMAPLATRASAMSSASGFQRNSAVSAATRGKALRPAVASGGTTGKISTPDSRQRRAVTTQVTGQPPAASSRKRASARSFSWLSSTTRLRPAAASAAASRRMRRARRGGIVVAGRAGHAQPPGQHLEQRGGVPGPHPQPVDPPGKVPAQPVPQRAGQQRLAAAPAAHQRQPLHPAIQDRVAQRPQFLVRPTSRGGGGGNQPRPERAVTDLRPARRRPIAR